MRQFCLILAVLLIAISAVAQGPAYPYNVALSWTLSSSPNIGAQKMYRGTATTTCPASFAKIADLTATATAFTDPNPPEGHYCYAVTAINKNNEESGLGVDPAIAVIPPPPPTGLGHTVAKNLTGGYDVIAQWTQSKSSDIAENDVYVGSKSGGPYNLLHFTLPASTKATYHKAPAGTYYVVATATGTSTGQSGASKEDKIIVPAR